MPVTSEAIRTLFLDAKSTYSVAEVAALLGIDHLAVQGWIESGELAMSRASLGQRIPHARTAFDLDALMLVSGDGELLGVDPRALLSMPTADAKAALSDPAFARLVARISDASPDTFVTRTKPSLSDSSTAGTSPADSLESPNRSCSASRSS